MVGTARRAPLPTLRICATKRRPPCVAAFFLVLLNRLKSPAAAADHGANRFIGPEILGAVDVEQGAEFRSRPVDAALDGADRAAANRRRVLIGEAGGADQDQRFALVLRELFERGAKFLELEVRALRRLGFQRLGVAAIGVLHLPPPR